MTFRPTHPQGGWGISNKEENMKYKKLTFLKVPFDNSYSNLYTFPDLDSLAPADIAQALINYGFPSYVITAEKNRHFKITNGNVIMSVPVDYDYIKNFNYVIAQSENADEYTQFYFVTGFSSLNTGEAPSTDINIQFDSYMNNYYYITTVSEKFTQSSGHTLDIVSKNNKIYPKQMYPSLSATNMIESPVNLGYKILWLELTLDGEGDYYNTPEPEESTPKATPNSVYGSASQLPIVLVPIAVLNTSTMLFEPDGSFELVVGLEVSLRTRMAISNQIFKIFGGLHIVQARLTYSCPFNYTAYTGEGTQAYFLVESNSYTLENLFIKTQIPTTESATEYKYLPLCETVSGSTEQFTVLVSRTAITSLKEVRLKKVYGVINTDYIPNYAITGDYKPEYIPQMKAYPFIQYKLICGNEQITLYPPEHCTNIVIYEIIEGYESVYQITYCDSNIDVNNPYGHEIYSTTLHPRNTNGFVPTVISSEDVYIRNNGNALNTQMQLARLNFAKNSVQNSLGYAISGIGAMITAVSNPIAGAMQMASAKSSRISNSIDNAYSLYSTIKSTDASIEDTKNAQDTITNVDANALKNALMQDSIIVRKCEVDPSCTTYNSIAQSIYKNGIDTRCETGLLDSNRKLFFYRKLINCSIPTITNIEERTTVESIFLNGATFWKLKYYPNNLDKSSVYSMQKTRNNPIV